MTHDCLCGGRNVPIKGTPHLARFKCFKCGAIRSQRKRQPKAKETPATEMFVDRYLEEMP